MNAPDFIQENGTTAVDTLTKSYSDQWAGANAENASAFVQFMSSNDLIFVVLGVSLIIWFVLLFFMIKVDRNVAKLEQQLEESNS
ncbi:MAG: CcmD family protein [Balneolaceae bacterium]